MVATATDIETVHLKNGSVINGVIIEQVPGTSIKIQTTDGNILSYEMSQVEKITREKAPTTKFSSSNPGGAQVGYRGFIDLGYTIGVGDYGISRLDITTSHGLQICPYFYFGIGVGLNYYFDEKQYAVPIFLDYRADILNKSITPFADLKVGYSISDVNGFYMAPSIGLRWGFTKHLGAQLSIGYTIQKAEYLTGFYVSDNGSVYFHTSEKNCGGLTIKLGFEF